VPVLAEAGDGLAGDGAKVVAELHDADHNAAIFSIGPKGQPTIRLGAFDSGVELPQLLACRSIQGEDFFRGREAVENSVDDDGAGLQAAGFFGVIGPGDLQLLDVLRQVKLVQPC
jgi:hypothetical protein